MAKPIFQGKGGFGATQAGPGTTTGITVTLIGPWAKTAKDLKTAPGKIRTAWRKAARPHLGKLRDQIRKQYKKAKPGLAKSTLLARKKMGRGGRKPLFVSGDLRGSVSLVRSGDDFFVGVLRTKKGKKGGGPMANLAELHEQGKTFAVPATKKSKVFLADVFSAPSIIHSKADFFVVTIPARPVFAPAFKAWDVKAFEKTIAFEMQRILFGVSGPAPKPPSGK